LNHVVVVVVFALLLVMADATFLCRLCRESVVWGCRCLYLCLWLMRHDDTALH